MQLFSDSHKARAQNGFELFYFYGKKYVNKQQIATRNYVLRSTRRVL